MIRALVFESFLASPNLGVAQVPKVQPECRRTNIVSDDMDIPGFRLHPLEGKFRGHWAISVSGIWRLTFEFYDGNVYVLDYEDYH